MTTDNATNKPAFHIFTEKGRRRVGAVFPHRKGGGYTILVNGRRYVAFPMRTTSGEGEGA